MLVLGILNWKGRNLGGKRQGLDLDLDLSVSISLSHQLFYYFTIIMINELSKKIIIIMINEI